MYISARDQKESSKAKGSIKVRGKKLNKMLQRDEKMLKICIKVHVDMQKLVLN